MEGSVTPSEKQQWKALTTAQQRAHWSVDFLYPPLFCMVFQAKIHLTFVVLHVKSGRASTTCSEARA
eukprot:3933965-Rhodomonas_salina.2